MAKTIKFNLILDNKPVRTIEELQENFCIDDIQEFYENGLLQKWLKVRGYDEYLKKVDEINDKKNAIIELVKIFGIESDTDIEEAIRSLKYWVERKTKFEELHNKDKKSKEIISNYHKCYDEIKDVLKAKKDDFAFIKSVVRDISKNYYNLIKIDFDNFFDEMSKESPLSLFAAMMDEDGGLRYLFKERHKNKLFQLIPSENKEYQNNDDWGKWIKVTNRHVVIKMTYNDSKSLKIREAEGKTEYRTLNEVKGKEFEHGFEFYSNSYHDYVVYDETVGFPVKTYCGETIGLEEKSKKVMILSIPKSTSISTQKDAKREFKDDEVNGKFIILDGLFYKSKNNKESIIYMEV